MLCFFIVETRSFALATVPVLGGLQHMISPAVSLQNIVLCSEVILGDKATGCAHVGSMQLYIVI